MQHHTDGDGCNQPHVGPGGHGQQAVVLTQRVQGVEHLHGHNDRQGQRRGLGLACKQAGTWQLRPGQRMKEDAWGGWELALEVGGMDGMW